MTLQMLEYFVALAEKGSFTDAANTCFVSQPALSRAIAALEKELDCALVDRENRKVVRLTPAGETLLVEARRIFQQMSVLQERVRRVAREEQREISIGYMAYGFLRDFLSCYADVIAENDVHLKTIYGSTRELRSRLLSGELDCALLIENSAYDLPDCRILRVYTATRRALIPRGHPLFDRESIRLEELKDSRFVYFDPQDLPLLFAELVSICREAGFTPKMAGFGHVAGDITSMMCQLGAVSVMCSSIDYTNTEDTRMVPLEGLREEHRVAMAIVTREEIVSPDMERFYQLLCRAQTA